MEGPELGCAVLSSISNSNPRPPNHLPATRARQRQSASERDLQHVGGRRSVRERAGILRLALPDATQLLSWQRQDLLVVPEAKALATTNKAARKAEVEEKAEKKGYCGPWTPRKPQTRGLFED